MHNKTVTILLAILVIALGISYFGINNYIFEKEGMMGKIDKINQLIEQEKWEDANILNKEIKRIWNHNKNWVRINFAEQEYTQFGNYLSNMQSGIKAKDLATALSNARDVKAMWKNLNKVVPEP